ncbi:MAG: hypothetical protein ABI208_05080 [Ginsengibacter sp.]
MKILFSVIFFSLMFATVNGQKISIFDLINFQKNNSEYFEQESLKKDFEYLSTQDDSDVNIISYALYQLKGTRSAHFLKYFTWMTGDITVVYQTTERAEFIKLKGQIKALGFKYFKTEKLEKEIIEYYKKERICIGFDTEVNTTNQNAKNNLFQIDVRPSSLVQN